MMMKARKIETNGIIIRVKTKPNFKMKTLVLVNDNDNNDGYDNSY